MWVKVEVREEGTESNERHNKQVNYIGCEVLQKMKKYSRVRRGRVVL